MLAGIELVEHLGAQPELAGTWEPCLNDGDVFDPGALIGRVRGPMRSLLAMERIALNFLQRLGGIATLTANFVTEAAGTRASIFDTRKTTPGWRALEKYAVRCGGGCNHRFGLFDAVLSKTITLLGWPQPPAGRFLDPIAKQSSGPPEYIGRHHD